MNCFIYFAAAYGLMINNLVVGRWARCSTKDHPRKKNGAYFFNGDYGHVRNWATMPEAATWFAEKPANEVDRKAMEERMAAAMKKAEAERKKQIIDAEKKAQWILSKCKTDRHAYLDSKGFSEREGLVYFPDEDTNLFAIPMRVGEKLVGVQLIDRNGSKTFIKGQRCAGAEYIIGMSGGNPIDIWCEGYATGLSIQEAIAKLKYPYRIHVCFSSGNMAMMAAEFGRGIVIADNDVSGTGELAAKDTHLPYFMPPDVGMDFNDFHQKVGTFRASQALRKIVTEAKR